MTAAVPAAKDRNAIVVAGMAAAAVAAFLFARDVIGVIAAMVGTAVFTPAGDLFTDFGWYFEGRFGLVLPMATGVFLGFWLLTPADHRRPTGAVLLRSAAAVAFGLVIYLVLGALFRWLMSPLAFAGAGVEIVATREQFLTVQFMPVFLLLEAAQLFVTLVPVVLLIGVLLWLWQRRRSAPAAGPGGAPAV